MVPCREMKEHTLFVAGVPETVEKSALHELFKPFGKILDIRITTRQPPRKSFAFISYKAEGEARAAMAALQGTYLDNHRLAIEKSKSPYRKSFSNDYIDEDSGLSDVEGDRGERRRENGHTVILSNLDYSVRNFDIRPEVEKIGPIIKIEVLFDGRKSIGKAVVEYKHSADARAAVAQLNGLYLKGSRIIAEFEREQRIHTLFISRIPKQASYRDLVDAFSVYGPVDSIDLIYSRPFAFLSYEDPEDAEYVIRTNPRVIVHGQRVEIERSKTPDKELLMTKCSRTEDDRRVIYRARSRSPERSSRRSSPIRDNREDDQQIVVRKDNEGPERKTIKRQDGTEIESKIALRRDEDRPSARATPPPSTPAGQVPVIQTPPVQSIQSPMMMPTMNPMLNSMVTLMMPYMQALSMGNANAYQQPQQPQQQSNTNPSAYLPAQMQMAAANPQLMALLQQQQQQLMMMLAQQQMRAAATGQMFAAPIQSGLTSQTIPQQPPQTIPQKSRQPANELQTLPMSYPSINSSQSDLNRSQ